MKKILLLVAVSCFLVACSKDEPCDMTGEKYRQMMKDRTPMSEKDMACYQARYMQIISDTNKQLMEKMNKDIEELEKEKVAMKKQAEKDAIKKQADKEVK